MTLTATPPRERRPPPPLLDAPGGLHRLVVDRHPEYFERALVLDVGSREQTLGRALPPGTRCIAIDLYNVLSGVTAIADVEKGLPFRDGSVDTVVALDVLEHVDRMLVGLREILRVAGTYCVLSLPNLYEITYRLRILLGRPVSGKYWLTDATALGADDRHRWFFTLAEGLAFVDRHSRQHGFVIEDQCLVTARYSRRALRLLQSAARATWGGRSLFGSTAVLYLKRQERVAEGRP